jgi:lipopolysaccharide transport system permease protein
MKAEITDTPVIQIRPTKGWASLQLRALWEYRELLYFLAWRDIKVRYKQTVLGAGWAIIQPVTTMLIFTIIFGRLAKIPSDNIPYPIFCFCALLPWNYFASAFSRSSGSLVNNAHLISKVYFPRLVIPISSLLSGLLDFAIAFLFLIGMMFYYHIVPTISILWLPVFMLMAIATALGVGLWLGALDVLYRDIGYLVPFLSQIWMYATPVVYPSSLIPEKWRLIYGLNPMAGVVEGFRWALIGRGTKPGPMLFVSAFVTIILLVSGAFYFRRMEKTFADVI